MTQIPSRKHTGKTGTYMGGTIIHRPKLDKRVCDCQKCENSYTANDGKIWCKHYFIANPRKTTCRFYEVGYINEGANRKVAPLKKKRKTGGTK